MAANPEEDEDPDPEDTASDAEEVDADSDEAEAEDAEELLPELCEEVEPEEPQAASESAIAVVRTIVAAFLFLIWYSPKKKEK